MVATIAILLLVLIGGLLLLIATRQASFVIERSATVAASPDRVFPLLNDFHQWTMWSPWEHRDPNLQRTYGGPAEGPGATYAWVGNKQVGEGRMTIVESAPNERVLIKLEFLKPMAATNDTTFTLTPVDGGTRVHWHMAGNNNFMGKAFSLMVDLDKMVGKDFEQGLASLDTAARAEPAPAES